jgi:hypothetical protein
MSRINSNCKGKNDIIGELRAKTLLANITNSFVKYKEIHENSELIHPGE